MVGLGLTDRAWAEANLPVSLGGLGISNPLLLRSSAYVASTLSYLSNRDLVTSGETPWEHLLGRDYSPWEHLLGRDSVYSLVCVSRHSDETSPSPRQLDRE